MTLTGSMLLQEPSILRTQIATTSAAPAISSPTLKPITSSFLNASAGDKSGKKTKKKQKEMPQLTLTHDKHLPIVLDILRAKRRGGTILVPFKAFKKQFKNMCSSLGATTNMTIRQFLAEETERGAIFFGYFEKDGIISSYLKLLDG